MIQDQFRRLKLYDSRIVVAPFQTSTKTANSRLCLVYVPRTTGWDWHIDLCKLSLPKVLQMAADFRHLACLLQTTAGITGIHSRPSLQPIRYQRKPRLETQHSTESELFVLGQHGVGDFGLTRKNQGRGLPGCLPATSRCLFPVSGGMLKHYTTHLRACYNMRRYLDMNDTYVEHT